MPPLCLVWFVPPLFTLLMVTLLAPELFWLRPAPVAGKPKVSPLLKLLVEDIWLPFSNFYRSCILSWMLLIPPLLRLLFMMLLLSLLPLFWKFWEWFTRCYWNDSAGPAPASGPPPSRPLFCLCMPTNLLVAVFCFFYLIMLILGGEMF